MPAELLRDLRQKTFTSLTQEAFASLARTEAMMHNGPNRVTFARGATMRGDPSYTYDRQFDQRVNEGGFPVDALWVGGEDRCRAARMGAT